MRAMKRIGSWSWELGVDRFLHKPFRAASGAGVANL
jgi:hypothetical protein